MDLKLCWGAQARGAQLGRASVASPWLQTSPESCSAFCCTLRPYGCPARAEHLQSSCSPPASLGLGNSSSLSILTSNFPIISPERLENTACYPSLCALPGLTDIALLSASALPPLSANGCCGICSDRSMSGNPSKKKQHLLLDQLRLFRKGHKCFSPLTSSCFFQLQVYWPHKKFCIFLCTVKVRDAEWCWPLHRVRCPGLRVAPR